ncbi:laccase 2 [Microthyrium microscopicum]|uniref:Laccase 2 n=1 Tax=Microthyrium microscopicum TaxID=703497 RepID=A0A6A6USJ6_9PEZI|nr:laccase 2 [Microthyrium microscopicum]
MLLKIVSVLASLSPLALAVDPGGSYVPGPANILLNATDYLPYPLSNFTTPDVAPSNLTKGCKHGPQSRGCWGNYSIDTNYYEDSPRTGVTREYWLDVVNGTVAPDGYEIGALTFNGTIPGPLIEANWGDELVIHVRNTMENNGTSIHWHGFRQLNNNAGDGVPGVTQCPIPPGETYTYKFYAEHYGTTWYHSHFTMQYSVGLQGPMIIHGPATANYDEDLGTVVLQDWAHTSFFALWWYDRVFLPPTPQLPPSLDSALINGKNVIPCPANNTRCVGGTSRPEWNFEKGKKYRMRLINTGVYSNMRFSIDNHTLTVIAMDFVPIVPYQTDNVAISMGQRYDIIVEANGDLDQYWLRGNWQSKCCDNQQANNTLGIIRYNNASTADPTTQTIVNTYPTNCRDEPMESLVPYLALDVGPPDQVQLLNLSFVTPPAPKEFLWTLNDNYLWVDWSAPTNLLLLDNVTSFADEYMVFEDDDPTSLDKWVYFIWQDQSARNRSHPMHLHGHDYWIVGTGPGNFTSTSQLNLKNPPRRDTGTWPESGYMVMAFKTDNPGTWLAHCHIMWHSSESLGIQFIEQPGQMSSIHQDEAYVRDTCNKWNKFWPGPGTFEEEDSGI